jgi:hypothetical protein
MSKGREKNSKEREREEFFLKGQREKNSKKKKRRLRLYNNSILNPLILLNKRGII